MTTMTEAALTMEEIERCVELLRGRRVVALVGAGCSTESGIPDYRGPDGSRRERRPIQYRDFMGSPEARVRYWARSTVGWSRIAEARPNAAHEALAAMEGAGSLLGLITQNVDGLHQAAGSRRLVELHGALARVRCMTCGEQVSREQQQERLLAWNGEWAEWVAAQPFAIAPDGDAELPPELLRRFRVPACSTCGGILKPDVVFFGENVPAETVAAAFELFDEGEILLVVGSSLTVYSGRRFVYRARDRGTPVAIANIGPTRGDEFASVKLDGRLGEVLPEIARRLQPTPDR